MGSESRFVDLPHELITKILEDAGPRATLCCQMTCRTLRDVVVASTRLLYLVELFAACQTDCQKDESSQSQLLNDLREREKAWNDLSWSNKLNSVEAPIYPQVHSLVSDILSIHDPGSHDRSLAWTDLLHSDGVIADAGLNWHQYNPQSPTSTQFSKQVVDASQDLIITVWLISYQLEGGCVDDIHLRTLKTFSPHPAAQNPDIRLYLDWNQRNEYIQDIHVAGDHLGILWGVEYRSWTAWELIILDWKTGVRKERRSVFPDLRAWRGFAFLTMDMILLPNAETLALDIFTFSDAPESMRYSASFGMLPLQSRAHLRFGDVVCSSSDTASRSVTDREPYRSDPSESIVAIRLSCPGTTRNAPNLAFVLVIRKSALISRSRLNEGDSPTPTVINWDDWGPHSTRLIPTPFRCSFAVSGTRLAFRIEHASAVTLAVYDFNRHRMLMHPDDESGVISDGLVERSYEFVHHPSTIQPSGIFQKSVVTGLPYRKIHTISQFRWDGILMDNKRIIGFRSFSREIDILDF